MKGSTGKWSLVSPLRRAVEKIKFLLDLNFHRWRLASIVGASSSRRMLSLNEDQEETSDDVDKKADLFISNFYRQLQMERQVSMQLRYCRRYSFDFPSDP